MIKEDKVYLTNCNIFFEYYDDENKLNDYLSKESDNIQCVVSKEIIISFGEIKPNLGIMQMVLIHLNSYPQFRKIINV